ncbi:30S ribosomal protein S17 [Candidatus Jorgensenbacteria bacterium CG10_big_fil_rev_8_21_14_0_10_54_38]|uniref:Small ribosomal subunit protein uS17 n=2 Tax=Candidatus Joergenseniibacteriota TaxID=1752739 RepID=A0A2M6WGB0_9BACT|nr:MAG: 30S ribosomal protein S17 [Candidatus Jorgensenbacteria bacterium CG23_combo_of_CG06-09_8_20_14_all_54_14]PIT91831.1 MAG: 30S ribosomal protein S17 [Candidatus Jorgensenbacteria bacterium CG10_big_fil_rev_8_21_14_0_10_54_38]
MRKLKGTIVSDTMNRTRVIEITRTKKHRRYERYFTVTKRLKADDPKNEYKTGEAVVIEETRPLSKEKRWRVVARISNK